MSVPVAVPSLLAIAGVRRLLLELENPEDEDPQRLLGEPIETWVLHPMAAFEGRTPVQVLAVPRGRCHPARVARETAALRKTRPRSVAIRRVVRSPAGKRR